MKSYHYDHAVRCTVPVASVMMILILSEAAPAAYAQRIPAVPEPTVVGTFCPHCKELCPGASLPPVCPHCGHTILPAPSGTQEAPPPRPADTPLYYDSPETGPGKLRTRHFETNGLPSKAEAWGKEMEERYRKRMKEQEQSFEKKKEEVQKDPPESTTQPTIRNPFANDPNVVDLSCLGNAPGTPDLLRQPEEKQPSEYDFPAGSPNGKSFATQTDEGWQDMIPAWGSTLSRASATWNASVTVVPYEPTVAKEILNNGGWVIAARDLDNAFFDLIPTKAGVNFITGREDNPYGMHWQIQLPDGQNVGYFNGIRTGEYGNPLPNIKSDSNTQYKGMIASGSDARKMTEAVANVKARWDAQFTADPEGHGYDSGSRNCQDFTGEVLREYNRLMSTQH